jgi:tetratricopeptide (TPR) repeat protein
MDAARPRTGGAEFGPLQPLGLFLGLFWIAMAGVSVVARGQDEASLRRYTEQAQQALAAKDLKTAASALENLAKLTPNSAEVRANLGMVYYTEGRFADAATVFEKALQLRPDIPNGKLMLALCDAEVGRWKQAQPALEAGFRNPPSLQIGRTVGIELMQTDAALREAVKALGVSEEMLRRFPDDPEVLYRASHLYGDRAFETMVHLEAVAPNSPWKLLALGEALEAQKRYDLAIIQYRKALSADAAIPGAHYRLGRALLLSGSDNEQVRDEALEEFQAAIAADPGNAGAEYEIGEIERRKGDSEQAGGHFLHAVEIDPTLEQAQIAVARMLISTGKAGDAVPHLREAIRTNPNNEVSHFFLAKAYKSLGQEANSNRESELYRECHGRSLAPAGAEQRQVLSELSPSAVTPQTIGSNSNAP